MIQRLSMTKTKKIFRVLVSEEVSSPPETDSDISYIYKPDLWQHPEQLNRQVRDVEGLIIRNQTQVDQALITSANKLQVIGRLGAGLDNIDLDAAREAGIQVVYAPRANTVAVVEYCLACIFNVLRNLPQAMRSASLGEWSRKEFTGRELNEIVIGLVGFGKIAQALAERLRLLGGKVIVYTRSPERITPGFAPVTFKALLEEADIVSLHVPGGSETRHLFGSAQFKIMKPTSWLLNTSRGSVVNEEDLIQALQRGDIAGAVSDVRENEPPTPGKLEDLPNFHPTPHIAAFTFGAQSRVNQAVFSGVAAVLRGGELKGLVNGG
jgi:phosphoglycerate dehydrogenase-like enzyme